MPFSEISAFSCSPPPSACGFLPLLLTISVLYCAFLLSSFAPFCRCLTFYCFFLLPCFFCFLVSLAPSCLLFSLFTFLLCHSCACYTLLLLPAVNYLLPSPCGGLAGSVYCGKRRRDRRVERMIGRRQEDTTKERGREEKE